MHSKVTITPLWKPVGKDKFPVLLQCVANKELVVLFLSERQGLRFGLPALDGSIGQMENWAPASYDTWEVFTGTLELSNFSIE
jgi:hypothetical protein